MSEKSKHEWAAVGWKYPKTPTLENMDVLIVGESPREARHWASVMVFAICGESVRQRGKCGVFLVRSDWDGEKYVVVDLVPLKRNTPRRNHYEDGTPIPAEFMSLPHG